MIYDLVPMAHVASVDRSIAFYARLGFDVRSRLGEPEAFWAALQSGQAIIMYSRASEPVVPAQQAILFYLYTADVLSLRTRLLAAGVTVSDIAFPPYMPEGEMRVTDPDGYCLLIGQATCGRGQGPNHFVATNLRGTAARIAIENIHV